MMGDMGKRALRCAPWRGLLRAANTVLAIAVICTVFAGCDQTVKRSLKANIRSITIKEFSNMSDQPVLPALLLEEIRREFRLDGRLTVMDTAEGADSQLDGTVAEYTRQPARFDRNNVVQEYRLRVVVDLVYKDLILNETLWVEKGPESSATHGASLRKLERYTNYVIVPASGLAAETEQDAQRRIARDLARDIVLKVIEGW